MTSLDPRAILDVPVIYNWFQHLVGAQQGRLQFVHQRIAPLARTRVLEVGCGTGVNCEAFPEGTAYVGCDLNPAYIAYATQRYGNRAAFYARPVGELRELRLERFDVVMALAVLHHLSDEEVRVLCDEVSELLNPGGLFVTSDPCYSADQSDFANWIASCDRGRFVRYPERYLALLGENFHHTRFEIARGKLLFIPCSGIQIFATL